MAPHADLVNEPPVDERRVSFYAEEFVGPIYQIVDDGHGNSWVTCGGPCGLEIVRAGHAHCTRPDCPER